MALAERLKQLKSDAPGCKAVVFGDLGTCTVLRSVADPGTRQETHDSALIEARRLLGEEARSVLDLLAEQEGVPPPVRALHADDGGVRLMRRGGETGEDALVLTLDARVLDAAGVTAGPLAKHGPASVAAPVDARAVQRAVDILRAIDGACSAMLDGND